MGVDGRVRRLRREDWSGYWIGRKIEEGRDGGGTRVERERRERNASGRGETGEEREWKG